MKHLFIFFLTIIAFSASGQDKSNYVNYNKLIEITGTEFVLASIDNMGKMYEIHSEYLLIINTNRGQSKQINFPKGASIQKVEQVKIDSLGINKLVVEASTFNLDGNKSIDWKDPKQILILSPDGQEVKQITEDKYFVRTWTTNKKTGTIVITGHYDSNNNGKYDKTDQNEIQIYDLKTLLIKSKI